MKVDLLAEGMWIDAGFTLSRLLLEWRRLLWGARGLCIEGKYLLVIVLPAFVIIWENISIEHGTRLPTMGPVALCIEGEQRSGSFCQEIALLLL